VISLVDEEHVTTREDALTRSYDGDLSVLSVGRLDPEKNPLLLAEVFARLRENDPRWRLVVCGEGTMKEELAEALREAGVEEHADLLGYVSLDGGLRDLYRSSHVFLHVSWTEGVPQVLFESFAAGLPVVATAVGGVPELAEGRSVLIPPGDAEAATEATRRVVEDAELRTRLVDSGLECVGRFSLDSEAQRVTALFAGNSATGL
jgi:glycosyltransferase involved in cell wall biosynthesis